jgi:DNA-binding transcriptional ArsR family regulator
MEEYKQEAKIFKALMHPARMAILDVLRDGEECVCHMEAFLGYRQAYISQHLMVLRDAGLVDDHRDGLNIFYGVTRTEVFTLMDTAVELTGGKRQFARSEHQKTACPCPKCNPTAKKATC